MHNDEIQELVNSQAIANKAILDHPTFIGESCEVYRKFREELLNKHFTRQEAIQIIVAMVGKK
jgi:hypothetical protein